MLNNIGTHSFDKICLKELECTKNNEGKYAFVISHDIETSDNLLTHSEVWIFDSLQASWCSNMLNPAC